MTTDGRPGSAATLSSRAVRAAEPRTDEARPPNERTESDATRDARADTVADAIHETAAEVKRRQLEQALDALAANGGLTDDQRRVIERLADRLVARLLAAPTASLRAAATDGDAGEVSTALRLFDAGSGMADE